MGAQRRLTIAPEGVRRSIGRCEWSRIADCPIENFSSQSSTLGSMDVAHPYAAVTGGGLEGEVLAVLAGTTKPLTGRQVARLARRGSDRGIRLALQRLAVQGLVDTLDAPPAVLYTLNREHIAAPVALALVELRGALLARLRDAIGSWQVAPLHASLFGSAARGDGGTE